MRFRDTQECRDWRGGSLSLVGMPLISQKEDRMESFVLSETLKVARLCRELENELTCSTSSSCLTTHRPRFLRQTQSSQPKVMLSPFLIRNSHTPLQSDALFTAANSNIVLHTDRLH
jgi:hypothetical protein